MQHLRTITRKAADRRREQREILLEAHARRDASVAKGKAKRKWGYNRAALKRIEEMGKSYDSDASGSSKSKIARDHRSKRTSSASADVPAAEDDRHGKRGQQGTKRKTPSGGWDNNDNATETSASQMELEARSKTRRRGTFWNNYQCEDEA
jgi:hypothetical protein